MIDHNFLFTQRNQANFFLNRRQCWTALYACHVASWPPPLLRVFPRNPNNCSRNWPLWLLITTYPIFFWTSNIFFCVLHRSCHTNDYSLHICTWANLSESYGKSPKKILSLHQISKSENKIRLLKQVFRSVWRRPGSKLLNLHLLRRCVQMLSFRLASWLCSLYSLMSNMLQMLAGHYPKVQNSVAAYLEIQMTPKFGLILAHDGRTKSH